MPFEDPNHTRRSLVVTSTAFIAFSLGGGHIKDNSLSLPLVNIEFAHVWVLAGLAWIGLFWFAFRYWQEHWQTYRSNRFEEKRKIFEGHHLSKVIAEKELGLRHLSSTPKSTQLSNCFTFDTLHTTPSWFFNTYEFSYSIYAFSGYDDNEKPKWECMEDSLYHSFKSFRLRMKILYHSCLHYNTISSMATPFWLFFAAVITGGYRVWESLSQTPALA